MLLIFTLMQMQCWCCCFVLQVAAALATEVVSAAWASTMAAVTDQDAVGSQARAPPPSQSRADRKARDRTLRDGGRQGMHWYEHEEGDFTAVLDSFCGGMLLFSGPAAGFDRALDCAIVL